MGVLVQKLILREKQNSRGLGINHEDGCPFFVVLFFNGKWLTREKIIMTESTLSTVLMHKATEISLMADMEI